MTFSQKLAGHAARVEARLAQLLDAQSAGSARLQAAMRHAVLGGGKRFRPFLVLESAAVFGLRPDDAIDAAAAVECVHCYSLVHDDLPAMDNDEMRRGQPTVWRAFDEWTAILAGDALLTLAFDVLARPSTHPDAEVRVALAAALAAASGGTGMVGGQALDLEAEKQAGAQTASLDTIRRMQAMKTGALIRFSAQAGAVLAKASEDDNTRLTRYGEVIGFAFQIADDLLDAEGDASEVGKAVAKDAAAGKATLVGLMGADAARRRLRELETEAIAPLEPFGPAAHMLREAARFVVNRRS
ncbi:MAG: polyprenyl synthetase family protein [Hyphomicrobiaceae bacterium]